MWSKRRLKTRLGGSLKNIDFIKLPNANAALLFD
jgi:hypothetical protein